MFNQLAASDLVIVFVCLIVSMAIHEAMHGFTAFWLGDSTAADMGRLTLNPLRHIDMYTTVALPMFLIILGLPPFFAAKPVPFNPNRVKYEEFGAALVGLAGPLTNLLLACVAAGIVHLASIAVGTSAYNILSIFIQINLSFFVFNMIPFPPLDGSRLLYAFAPEPIQEVMYKIESLGFTAILLFMFVFFQFLGPAVTTIIQNIYNFLLH